MSSNKNVPEFPDILLCLDNYKKNVIPILTKVRPYWDLEQLQYKDYTTGKLNVLMGVFVPSDAKDVIVIRMFPVVESVINKEAEIENMKMLNEVGLGPAVVAFFKNGFCYEFIHGENLTCDSIIQEPVWRLVAEAFAHLHSKVKPKGMTPKCLLFQHLEAVVAGLPEELPEPELNKRFKALIPPKDILNQEILYFKSQLEDCGSPVVFSHNDCVPENIIWDKKNNKVTLIDFEFAAFNYQAADIAFHFCEFIGVDDIVPARFPDRDFQLKWLRLYLTTYSKLNNESKSEVTDEEIGRLYVLVNKFAALHHFFAALISVVIGNTVNAEFHYPYALKRYETFLDWKEKLMNTKY